MLPPLLLLQSHFELHWLIADRVETLLVILLSQVLKRLVEDSRRNGGERLVVEVLSLFIDLPVQSKAVVPESVKALCETLKVGVLPEVGEGHSFFLLGGEEPFVLNLVVDVNKDSSLDGLDLEDAVVNESPLDRLEGDKVVVVDGPIHDEVAAPLPEQIPDKKEVPLPEPLPDALLLPVEDAGILGGYCPFNLALAHLLVPQLLVFSFAEVLNHPVLLAPDHQLALEGVLPLRVVDVQLLVSQLHLGTVLVECTQVV